MGKLSTICMSSWIFLVEMLRRYIYQETNEEGIWNEWLRTTFLLSWNWLLEMKLGIALQQKAYIKKVLEQLGLNDCNLAKSSMERSWRSRRMMNVKILIPLNLGKQWVAWVTWLTLDRTCHFRLELQVVSWRNRPLCNSKLWNTS